MKLTAMALMVFALGLPSFADVPWTDVETVTAYLTNMLPAAVSDVRVYASSEAVPLVDRYFANLPEAFEDDPEGNCPDPKTRLMRMRHFLENEFAFVYSFSTVVSNLESVAAGKVSGDVSVYVFQPRVFSRFNIVTDPPRVMIGQRHLDNAEYVVLSKADGRCCNRLTDDEPTREGQPLPFKNRKLETNVCVPTSEADDNDDKVEPAAVVVADVEGAFFDTVRNMNPSCVKEVTPTSHALISPVATYRVELLVRRVEDGSFPYERLAFTVDPDRDRALYEAWPFYRGMTLGVALCRIDGALRIRRVWPVTGTIPSPVRASRSTRARPTCGPARPRRCWPSSMANTRLPSSWRRATGLRDLTGISRIIRAASRSRSGRRPRVPIRTTGDTPGSRARAINRAGRRTLMNSARSRMPKKVSTT